MNRRRLDVAVADAEDLLTRVGAADERVVLRDGAVGVDACHLAEQAVHALRLHAPFGDRPLAVRDEQRAVLQEIEPRAEVHRRIQRWTLVIDDLRVFDASWRTLDELASRHGRVV